MCVVTLQEAAERMLFLSQAGSFQKLGLKGSGRFGGDFRKPWDGGVALRQGREDHCIGYIWSELLL